jgi:hypothetical protein
MSDQVQYNGSRAIPYSIVGRGKNAHAPAQSLAVWLTCRAEHSALIAACWRSPASRASQMPYRSPSAPRANSPRHDQAGDIPSGVVQRLAHAEQLADDVQRGAYGAARAIAQTGKIHGGKRLVGGDRRLHRERGRERGEGTSVGGAISHHDEVVLWGNIHSRDEYSTRMGVLQGVMVSEAVAISQPSSGGRQRERGWL